MAVETTTVEKWRNRAFKKVLAEVTAKLESLCSGDSDLERWFRGGRRSEVEILVEELLMGARDPDEVEERLREVLDALPRYVRLVKRTKRIEKLQDQVNRAIKYFRALAPLSSELRETGLEFEGSPVYVGDWIKVNVGGRFYDIDGRDHVLFKFLAEHGREIAKHVDDEEKREVFLKLVELARQLGPVPEFCVRDGVVEVVGYDIAFYKFEKVRGELKLCPLRSLLYIGEKAYYPPRITNLLTLIPIMDSAERLYDEAEKYIEHNERILEEMRRVVRPYIVDRVLG